MTARLTATLAGAIALVGASSAAIGDTTPAVFRIVTMDGTSSPAFYSVVERRYVFVGTGALEASASEDALSGSDHGTN